MADQSVALQIRPFDATSPLAAASNYQTSQLANETSQLANDFNREVNPIKLQSLNRANAVEDVQFRNQLMSSAVQRGSINADAWDAEMQRAKSAGAPEAGQWIGRYPGPVQAARVAAAYTGAPSLGAAGTAPAAGAAGGTAPQGDVVQQLQNLTPDHAAAALKRTTMISDALAGIRDQKTHDAAIANLKAAGIPINPDANRPFDAFDIYNKWNNLQPIKQQLQKIVDANTVGVPSQRVAPTTKDVGGVMYNVDPYSPQAKPMTPPVQKPVPDSYGPNGEPLFYTEQGGLVRPGTVTPDVAATRIMKRENDTGNPSATNPRSSAMGNGQFIDKTWLETVKDARPELAKSLNDKQLLALRADPEFSSDMTKVLTTKNADALGKANLPVNTASLALAHQFGVAGATKILNAAPNTPMDQIVSPEVLKANPELKGQTAGTYAQGLIRQVGNDPVATGDQGGQIFHKGQYDKPQLVETDDGKGGTTRVLAQQNNRTGQWVTADEKRTPIDANNMVIIPESMGAGGGGRFAGQVMRILNSAKGATSEIANIVSLPIESSSGWFGGRGQGPSLLAATKEVLANTVTSQEVQDFNTSMIGLSRHLATLETGGMQTNEALVKKFEGLALKEGDTYWTKMRKLGTMRQDAQNAIESLMTSPLVGKKQIEFAQSLVKDLQAAVPWTPNDVTRLQRAADKNPAATIGDIGKTKGLGTQGYVEGQLYTDAKGNKAKYLGAGKWEPVTEGGK